MMRWRDRGGKPIDVIILDSLAAYVPRFTVAESALLRKEGPSRSWLRRRTIRQPRRVRGELPARHAQHEREPDQTLLRPVVEVALEPPAFAVAVASHQSSLR
jgi:hypothetical protein